MRRINIYLSARFILIGSLLWVLLPFSESVMVKAATIGEEFQINTYTDGPQTSAVMAMDLLAISLSLG